MVSQRRVVGTGEEDEVILISPLVVSHSNVVIESASTALYCPDVLVADGTVIGSSGGLFFSRSSIAEVVLNDTKDDVKEYLFYQQEVYYGEEERGPELVG